MNGKVMVMIACRDMQLSDERRAHAKELMKRSSLIHSVTYTMGESDVGNARNISISRGLAMARHSKCTHLMLLDDDLDPSGGVIEQLFEACDTDCSAAFRNYETRDFCGHPTAKILRSEKGEIVMCGGLGLAMFTHLALRPEWFPHVYHKQTTEHFFERIRIYTHAGPVFYMQQDRFNFEDVPREQARWLSEDMRLWLRLNSLGVRVAMVDNRNEVVHLPSGHRDAVTPPELPPLEDKLGPLTSTGDRFA